MTCILAINDLENVVMLEAFANQPVLRDSLDKTLAKALKESKLIIKGIKELQNSSAKPKRDINEFLIKPSEEYYSAVRGYVLSFICCPLSSIPSFDSLDSVFDLQITRE